MKASNQLTILNIEEQTYEDICTHDTTTGLIECTHAQDQGCVRITEIQGKSEQVQSTQGKNLLDLTHAKITTPGTGFTYTIQNSNAITLNCTNPGAYSSLHINLIGLTVGKSYCVSSVQSGKNLTLAMDEATDAEFINRTDINVPKITVREGYFYKLKIYANINGTSSTETYTNTYTNIQLEEGSTATAYEPFTPNSPSPDYPSVINSVGDSGKLNVVSSVGRRNLFEKSDQFMLTPTWNGAKGTVEEVEEPTSPYGKAIKITITTAGRGFYCYSGFMPMGKMEVGHKYTWGLFIKSNRVLTSEIFGHECGGTKNYTVSSEWEKYSFSYTMSNSPYKAFLMYFNFAVGDTLYIHSFKLVEGETIDDWSPAPEDITPENAKQYEDKLSLATVNLTSPLRSLPNGIHDVLECKDEIWGITRNVGKEIWNGSETWVGYSSTDSRPANTYVYYISFNNSVYGYNISQCSSFKNRRMAWSYGDVGTYSDHPSNNYKYFVSNLPTVTEFKSWLTRNNITINCGFATPTWEPLDDASQKALNNLLSYSGKDYIYTTDPLGTNFSVAVKSRAFYENFKLQEEIKNTNTSLDDLDDEIKGGFYDGIINTNEAEAIRKAAETMHTQVTNQFNKVDSNPSLTGAPKTTHQTKYTECNNAYNTLISKINTAIDYCSVNSTKTDAQKKTAVTDMNTAFGTYKTKLADYQKAYQDAIDAIAKKKADDAVDGVVIGGRNLLLDSGRVIETADYLVAQYKTLTLKPNTKYTFVINGFTNSGNRLGLWFNSGSVNSIMFDSTTIAKTQYKVATTPDVLNSVYVNIYNFPSATATSATINWACMYEGEIKPPLDWIPAPEDTDEKITQVSATLTSTINDVKHTVDKNTKSITDKVWKSDIITGIKDLNVGGINLWDLSAIKRYASGNLNTIVAGTTVDAKTGKITVTADPQAVPGCKIDVSTLTRNSSNIGELVITGYFDRTDSDNNKLKNVYLYYRCFNNANAEIQAHTNKLVPVETSSNLFAGTLSIPANTAYINFGVGQIPYVKPYALTGVTVKDSALYDITKGLRDQVSKAYQDINGFKQTVSDTYTTKTEFDQLSIGGRNLFTKSNLNKYANLDQWNVNPLSTAVLDAKNSYNEYKSIKITSTGNTGINSKKITLLKGKTYTWSFYVKATETFTPSFNKLLHMQLSDGSNIHCETNLRFSPTKVLANTWTKVSATFDTPTTADTYTFSGYIWYLTNNQTYNVCCFKLEEGNKATDYTEAPEDIDEKFTNYSTTSEMNSKIDQTKSDIELGVSRTYTSKAEGDKITQGLNKWILEVYQLTSSSMPNPRVANIENIRGKVPTKIVEVADTSTNININVGDYYIGHAFTYLYFDTAYTWSGTIMTDDEGAVYLNGVKKVSTAVRVFTNVTLPFQAGWNVLEIVYNEGGVDDGWLFSSKLSTLSQCKIMNCYAQVSLNASALIKVTADAISQKVENDAAYAEFTEQAGKMAWLVASGKDAASMELTPEALNVIADKINLTGKVTFSSLAIDAKKKIEEAKQAGTDAQESLNNLTIGGRNLLLDSGRVITTTTAYNVVNYRTSSLKPNTKYTVVINAFTNSGNSLGVWFNSGNDGGIRFPATTVAKTQYIVVTTPATLNSTTVYIYNYPQSTATNSTINWACMYEGEIKPPLDWSPSPEDINNTISALGEDLQDQIDGKIESYNQTTNPADAWTTAAIKTQHTGDIWYNDSTKLTQRWSGTAWLPLKDADALAAQELAKQKRRVFTAIPTTPYDVGDLWVQGGTGDIMKCKTALASGSYNVAHWEKASKYTDDTTANQAVSNTILTPADKISLYATFLSIQNEYSRLKEQCTNLGVADTLKTSYDALYALLNGIVGTTTLQNSITSGFNKSNYDTLYKNYVTAREVLEQAQITKVYAYTNTIKEHFTTEKALAVANWFASQDKTMIDGAYIYTGTVTAKQIAANSIDTDRLAVGMNPNLVRYGLDTMEQFSTVPYFSKSATATVSLDDSQYYIGTKSIKFIGTSDSNSVCLGSKDTDYGCVPVTSGKTYILSCYVKTTSTSNVNAFLGFVAHPDISASNIINHGNASKTLKNTDGWVRLSIKYTASSAYPYASIRINVESPSYPVWFDAFQIEEVDSEDKEPGTFKQAGTTIIDGGNITTGIMKSANYNYVSGNFAVAGTMIDLATGVIRSKGFGMDASGNSYFNGTVTATTLTATANGNIAGWNINSYCLYRTSFTWGNSTGMYFGSSGLSVRDKFKVDASGNLTATSATINGNITATSGFIGNGSSGFTIKSTSIYNGMSSLSSAATGIYLGTDGISLGGGKFKVDKDGITTATSGIIGGWNITPDSMNRQFTANNKNYWLYFDTGTTSDAFAAFMLRTKATTASAWEDKFSIAWNGRMTAMDADVRGTITAMSGTIGGFSITNGSLTVKKTEGSNTYDAFLINALGVSGSATDPYLQVRTSLTGVSPFVVNRNDVMINSLKVNSIGSYTTEIRVTSPLVCLATIYENNQALANTYSKLTHSHAWGAVTGKPSSFPPASHQHGQLHQDGTAVVTTSNSGTIFRASEARGDNKVTLGSSNYRWVRLWAAQGTISTSDKNDKINFRAIDYRYENMFMDIIPGMFQYKNFTVNDKHDRLHCGIMAQDLEYALHKNNLAAELFAALCRDDLEIPTPDGRTYRYGINYSELHGLEIHMIQKTIHRVNDQEQIIQKLEEENKDLRNKNDGLAERLDKLEKIVESL